ncbi:hypothetical protein, variant [Aphanomyces invadans]|uniref:Uncharacterized protein n=2 Tax=Aphanomyces invadans TaxID=157072 RepID=A0A024UDT6_9STRA|nr:hypothetical protein, variant [Aphanomyces invadans]ETW03798.1 hypothetical protein, variant [Aphanomyces invadans]|eukprot:XP_008868027.1 hypothetical protein, variant [Aphanomyces invadans]
MLDGIEKDRIKDRHAKSVEDSKARSSIVLENKPTIGKGKTRTMRQTVLLNPSLSLKATSTPSTSMRKRRLPSALTPESLESMMQAIDKDELRHIPLPPAPIFPSESASSTSVDAATASCDGAPGGTTKKKSTKKSIIGSTAPTQKKPTKKELKAAAEAAAKHLQTTVEEDEPAVHADSDRDDRNLEEESALPSPQEFDVIKKRSSTNSPPLIRAKRRVLSSALNSLSTFTPDVEAVFKRHIAVPRTLQPITSAEDLVGRQKQHKDLLAEWTLLDKAYAVENVLRHGEAITGTYGLQAATNTTAARRRVEGMSLLRKLLAQLHEQLEQLHAAITVYTEDVDKATATTSNCHQGS